MERDCGILEEIMEKHATSPEEKRALMTAIRAYSWVCINEDLRPRFIDFLANLGRPLSEEERQSLRDRGIDPDEEPPDCED